MLYGLQQLGNSHCIYLNVSMFLMGLRLLFWYFGGRFLLVVVLVAMGDHFHNLLNFLAVFGWYLASLSTDEIPDLSFIIGMYFMCFLVFKVLFSYQRRVIGCP